MLRTAGLDPLVTVSGVDEDAVLAAFVDRPPAEQITGLAEAKADAVVTRIVAGELPEIPSDDLVVIGCDSMLLIDDELKGKPADADRARLLWRQMAGREALLITGHAIRRLIDGRLSAAASDSLSSIVRMGTPSEREVEAYISTGEPLAVAGGLTIDGFGGWFVDGVDGDPSNVLGISLPLTRRLLADIGVEVTDLWRAPSSPA